MWWWPLVLRLVLLLVPLQASGTLHAVADLVVVLAGETIHQGKPVCPHEEQGESCPPGCPDCHCFFLFPALPPPVACLVVKRGVTHTVEGVVYDATAPPRPPLAGLERPPRHAALA